MRLTSGNEKKQTPYGNNNGNSNLLNTKSLIEDGSEDFTNIEEHIHEDTRISCSNAVTSSLNNVSMSNILEIHIFSYQVSSITESKKQKRNDNLINDQQTKRLAKQRRNF